ncbi:MAG: 6-bladed beta-propeller [Candidatus Omnitrophica bacterium]|nr:6-bladed beta-propeller [Candidatus Omnitrophota bacterium]
MMKQVSRTNRALKTLSFVLISLIFMMPVIASAMENVDFVRELKAKLNEPADIVISKTLDIYVLDKKQGIISIYDAFGNLTNTIGEAGTSDEYLSKPRSIALTLEEDIVIADTGNNRVVVFNSRGDFLYELGNYGKKRGQFILPISVAVDPIGYIYVADASNKTLSRFSPHGVFLGQKETDYKPQDIVFDPQRNMYVLYPETGSIFKYSPEGKVLSEIKVEINGENCLHKTVGIDVDTRGDIYLIETAHHTIKKIDQKGNILFSFGSQGAGRGQFEKPLNIATDTSDNVYIADSKNGRVQVLKVYGSIKSDLNPVAFEPPIIDFVKSIKAEEKISDIFINQRQEIYTLSDYYDHIVWHNDRAITIGEEGRQAGQFKQPKALYVDYEGKILVSDTGNHRLQFLRQDGTHDYHFGVKGTERSKFLEPSGVAINHKGEIYVADTLNHRIQIFNPDGIHLKSFGKKMIKTDEDPAYGGFQNPTAIIFNSKEQLYVLDNSNKRIQVFTKDGDFIQEISGGPNHLFEFLEPTDITIDENDYLYVADRADHSVKIFEPDGKYFIKFGSPGKGPSYFPKISSVAASRGKIYVADYNVDKIKVFRFNPHAEWDYAAEDLPDEDILPEWDYTAEDLSDEDILPEQNLLAEDIPIYDVMADLTEEIAEAIPEEPIEQAVQDQTVQPNEEERILLTIKSHPLTEQETLDPQQYSNVRRMALQKIQDELSLKLGISKEQIQSFMNIEAEEILPTGQLMLTVSVSKQK